MEILRSLKVSGLASVRTFDMKGFKMGVTGWATVLKFSPVNGFDVKFCPVELVLFAAKRFNMVVLDEVMFELDPANGFDMRGFDIGLGFGMTLKIPTEVFDLK